MNCHEQMSQFLSFSTNNVLYMLCLEGEWGWMGIYVEHVRTLYPLAFIFFWLAAVPLLRYIMLSYVGCALLYSQDRKREEETQCALLLLVGAHMFSGYIFRDGYKCTCPSSLCCASSSFFSFHYSSPTPDYTRSWLWIGSFFFFGLVSFFPSFSLTVKSETRGCPSFWNFPSAFFIVGDSLLIVHTVHKRRKVIAADAPSMYDEEWNEKKTDNHLLLAPYFWDNNNNW